MYWKTFLCVAVLALLIACGDDDDDSSQQSGSDSTNPSTSSTSTGSTPEPADDSAAGGGDFSVVMVLGVDIVTADGQFEELEAAGFEGFVKEGSAESGYAVYRSGLTEEEASTLLDEIREEIFPEASGSTLQPGLVMETGSWESDEASAEDEPAGALSSASVVVGDKVYDFLIDLPNQCGDNQGVLFGTFAVDAMGNGMQGGDANRAVALNFSVPPSDWQERGLQPPQIAVDDATTGQRWQAGGVESAGIDSADSSVISWELVDGVASGSATFIDLNAHFAGQETEPMGGTFDITCGE